MLSSTTGSWRKVCPTGSALRICLNILTNRPYDRRGTLSLFFCPSPALVVAA